MPLTAPPATPRPGRRRAAVVAVALIAAIAGIGGSGAEARPTPRVAVAQAADPPEVIDQAGPVELYTGDVDGFYDVPDPLPAGEPGDVIRLQALESKGGDVGWRVMYHSTDDLGRDRAVTGVLYHPTGEAPAGGWPVLSHAHGTTGLAAECAPSRLGHVPGAWGTKGVRLAADYLGLGPNGELHPYLNRIGEAYPVLDLVRAAHHLTEANAGDDWLLLGGSQGGHAALVANELADERLPEYPLLGTVAIAPGAQFSESFDDIVQLRIITTMILFGARADDPALDPADYLLPEAHDLVEPIVTGQCADAVISATAPYAARSDFYVQDPDTSEAARSWLRRNDAAQGVGASPLLVVAGGNDAIVVPRRSRALYARLCAIGQTTAFIEVPEGTHPDVGTLAAADISAWLADRQAGEPAPDTCGDPLPPLPGPAAPPTTSTSPTPLPDPGGSPAGPGTATAATPRPGTADYTG